MPNGNGKKTGSSSSGKRLITDHFKRISDFVQGRSESPEDEMPKTKKQHIDDRTVSPPPAFSSPVPPPQVVTSPYFSPPAPQPPRVTNKPPHGLTMDGITPPPHLGTGHASKIGFKIMEIFQDHNKEHRNKQYLYSHVHPGILDSGGLRAVEGLPRPHSEINALRAITGTAHSSPPDVQPGSHIGAVLNEVIAGQQKRKAQGQAPGQLRVKFYIQNSATPPCTTPYGKQRWAGGPIEEIPGIPCDTYLQTFVDKLKGFKGSKLDARMKVHNPSVSTTTPGKNTKEKTKKYGYKK